MCGVLVVAAVAAGAARGGNKTTNGNGKNADPPAMTYSGDASPVMVSALIGGSTVLGIDPVHPTIPSTGGSVDDSAAELNEPGPPIGLQVSLLTAHAFGGGQNADSGSNVATAAVQLPEQEISVDASVIETRAEAVCDASTGNVTVSGSSKLASLSIVQSLIPVDLSDISLETPGPDQVVLDSDVARIVLNEQLITGQGTPTASIEVNAIHITLPETSPLAGAVWGDIIIGHAHADLANCGGPVVECDAKDFVTGGGWIEKGGQKATFGMVGFGLDDGSLKGNLQFNDHAGTRLHGKGGTHYEATGDEATTRHLIYTGTDGSPIELEVSDIAEPGGGVDRFVLTGFAADSDTIVKGNIQLHKPKCPSSQSTDTTGPGNSGKNNNKK